MRIGIYLGRHSGSAGALGVFARSLIVQLIAASSKEEAGALELVIYGDAALLDSQFLERLSLLPQLIEPLDTIFTRGAGAFMRILPNGARIRVVIRRLPSIPGASFSQLFDQALVPLLAKRDRIDLLHSVANIGVSNIAISTILASSLGLSSYFSAAKVPQITTVHDLEKVLPIESSTSKQSSTDSLLQKRNEVSSVLLNSVNKLDRRNSGSKTDLRWFGISAKLILLQYRSSLGSVFVATRSSVQDQLIAKIGLSRESVCLIRPGVDEYFARFGARLVRESELNREIEREIDRLFGFKPGYVLHFYSPDKMNSSVQAIYAWKKIAQSRPEHLVLVNMPKLIKIEGSDDVNFKDFLSENNFESRVHLLPWVNRENMPLLMAGASVLLAPSQRQEWELVQLEALTVGTPVVLGGAADWAQPDSASSKMVFRSEVDDQDSIATALEQALGTKDSRIIVTSIRTMERVARDYLNLYRDVLLKFGKRRPPA